MNKLCFGILFSLIASFVFSQKLELNTDSVDFGKIKSGSEAKEVLMIKNSGNAPLVITDVKSSCGCTVPKWPNDPIMPGKSEPLTIEYDTKKMGTFSKVIEVFSNDTSSQRKVIRVKGNVY